MATGITENDVWKAADALLLEGQRPTIERVRQKIGRGSPNTVQPHLDSWFRGLGARIRDPKIFAAPSSTPDPVTQVAEHLWQVALSEARASVEQDYAARMEALALDRRHLEDERQAFREKEREIQARYDAAKAERNLMASQLEEMRQREATAQLAFSGANAHVTQLSEALRTARMQLDEARGSFDRERRALQEQSRQQETHWLMEIDRLRLSVREAKSQAEALERHEREAIAGLTQRAFDAESRLALLQDAHIRAQEQLAEQSAQMLQQQASVETTRRQLDEVRIRAAALQQTLDDLRRIRLTQTTARKKSRSAPQGKWLKRRTRPDAGTSMG